MEKVKLNKLPVPTFGRSGVNYTEREINSFEAETLTVENNDSKKLIQYIDTTRTFETRLTVGSGAKARLVQIFHNSGQTVSRLDAVLEDNAKLELIQLYLGDDTVSEINTRLKGENSEFSADIAYSLDKNDTLDINMIAEHYGRKSSSQINVGGVLNDSAAKTFKGTIDFKHGAVGAKGSEQEEALLLSEKVHNRTVPVILCAEEDVQGSHGANIGRIDEKLIFYMQSRGMSEESIYRLLARSKLERIIRSIEDDDTEKRIYNTLEWEYEQ